MEIILKFNKNDVTITINGNIDSNSRDELNDKFAEAMNSPEIKNAYIDLKGLKSINSAGIGKLLKLYKHFNGIGGEIAIIHISKRVHSLFKDINLDKIIPISE